MSERSGAELFGILIKPLARYCFRNLLSFQDLLAVAKSAFVTAAAEELKRRSDRVNTSRVSAMTGIIRREVKRLLADPRVGEYQPSVLSRILSLWEQDRRFTVKPGVPRELSCGSTDCEFNELVYSISRHLNAGTLLAELERIEAVKRTDNRVRLVRRIGRTKGDVERAFQLVSNDIDTLLRAAEENIIRPKPISNMHIRTEFDNIYASDLPVIRRWMIDEGKRFHKRARDFLSQFDKDVNPRPDSERANVRVALTTASFTDEFPDQLEVLPEIQTPEDH